MSLREPVETPSERTLRAREESNGSLTRASGAQALGALAIGALAIGRLAIGRARIRRLEIDELVVRKLRITEELQAPSQPHSESES